MISTSPSLGLRLYTFARMSPTIALVCLVVAEDVVNPAAAQRGPQPAPPDAAETSIFNAVRARLATNTASIPKPVTEALGTFSNTLTKTLVCPASGRVTNVIIRINTSLVHWDTRLARPGSAGTTFWNPQSVITNNTKTVTCLNWMMFDTNAFGGGTNATDPVLDEGLLYHELLHLQLLIDSMTNGTPWQTQVCNCVFNQNSEQADHLIIFPLQDGYVGSRLATAGFRTINALAQRADTNGVFDIDLGPAAENKPDFTWEVIEPAGGSNVDSPGVAIEPSDGHYHFHGTLHDPARPGQIWVRIDPPVFVLFAGVEYSLLVLPRSPLALVSVLGNDQNGRFRFALFGDLNAVYGIQVSSNLLQWVPLGAVTNFSGVVVFTDLDSPSLNQRFYRAQFQ